MTIGERRYAKQDVTPGPGYYEPEKADVYTRSGSQITDFTKVPVVSMRQSIQFEVHNVGPGSYDPSRSFTISKPSSRHVSFVHASANPRRTSAVKQMHKSASQYIKSESKLLVKDAPNSSSVKSPPKERFKVPSRRLSESTQVKSLYNLLNQHSKGTKQ